jgi:SAM-dependent methyltransferase
MSTRAGRLGSALVAGLDRRTRPSRERIAVTGFFLGTQSALDNLLSRAFFELSNRDWARAEEHESHHLAFRDGLSRITCEPSTVVDLGTGAGGSAAVMAKRWPAATVVGVDSSRQMVRRAREQHQGVVNLTFHLGDGLRLSLGDETVDLVASLNYMPFPGEVRRILRPGGLVLVASTFQSVGSAAIEANWSDHGFTLEAKQDAQRGSFELYRRSP